jgi:uncharacterized protein DUF4384
VRIMLKSLKSSLPWIAAIAFCCSACAQDTPAPAKQKLLLSIECWKEKENAWKAADVQTVFKQKDRLRFKFRTSVPGYLYILNQGSGGTVSWLYPVQGKPANMLTGAHEVIIPSAEGSWVIGGPAGFDTLYWIMRDTPMSLPEIAAEKLDVPSTMVSRCPEESSSSQQMACLDKNAGAKPLSDPKKLQGALGISDTLVARDLTFESKPKATEITTDADSSSNGIIYQVRIAHN